ncbi:MAG: SH3 domain-containing protein [Leptolyngbyaceae bacterium]|nr:SH3 domain-containing protein [Leptolyngbyaceae bacterium]
MPNHRSWLITCLTVLASVAAVQSPAKGEITIRIGSHRDVHHRYGTVYHRDVPFVRTVYPDGRVVERYGYSSGHPEVLVLPSPITIRHPTIQPSIVQPYIIHPLPSTVLPGSINAPLQTVSPRLLHGRSVQSTSALVLGIGGIPGREGPGAVYEELTRFVAGQVVIATQVAGGGDGFDWFLVASPEGQQAWIRGDRLSFFERSR